MATYFVWLYKPPCSAPNGAAYVSTTNQIIWNWNAVAGATGYKYNTVNNLATAINNFDCLTFTQTGVELNLR